MKLFEFLKSKLIKDFSYTFFGNLVYAGILFIANTIIARILGPARFGDFSLVYAVLYMITIFSDFGLSISLSKFIPEYYSLGQEQKANNLMNISFKLKLIGSSVIAIIGILLSNLISVYLFKDSGLTLPLIIVFLSGIGLSLYELLSKYFQAKEEFLKYSIFINIRAGLILISIIFLVQISFLTLLNSILIFSVIPPLIFLITFLIGKGFKFSLKTESKNLNEFIRFNIYIIIANIANVLISRIDLFFIKFYLDSASVGYYSVANQLIQIIVILTNSITVILLPKISQLTTFTQIKKSFYKILRFSSLLYLFIFPLLLVAPFLINFIFSSLYAESIKLFQILALAFGLSFIINPLSTIVYKFNKPKIIAIMVISRLVLILAFEPIFLIFFKLDGVGLINILNFSFALIYIITYLIYKIFIKNQKTISENKID